MFKISIKSVAYVLRWSYFSGGMSGTVLSHFMKSTTSEEFHWIVLDTSSVTVGFQVVSYVYLEGMSVKVFSFILL